MLVLRPSRVAPSLPATFRLCAIVLPAFVALLLVDVSSADPPTATFLFPAGGMPGRQVAVTVGGKFSHWPPQVWCSSDRIEFKPEAEQGRCQIAIANDAGPGVYWLRLYDEEGATTVRPFIVGNLPTQLESEPNDDWMKPQRISLPATIDGRLDKSGDVDVYAISLRAGETLVASLEANEILRSPMDGVLQLCGSDGFVIRQIDDSVGLDPRLVFKAEADGTYLIRAFAFPAEPTSLVTFAGAEDYAYRLTLTSGPFIDHVLPMSANKASDTTVQLHGWNLAKLPTAITVPPGGRQRIATLSHADAAGLVRIPYLDMPTLVSGAPVSGEGPRHARPVHRPIPFCVSGHIREKHGTDAISFETTKGQRLNVCVESQSLGFVLDAVVLVSDADGKVLAEEDGHKKTGQDKQPYDPQFTFTIPAEGTYTFAIRDLHGGGGMRFAYRMTIDEVTPGYRLSVEEDAFVVDGITALEIPVAIERLHGFDQPIEITAEGIPDQRSNDATRVVLNEGATEFAVSPDEEEVAFVVRGEVFVASVEYGTTRRITFTPAQERSISWSDDGRVLYYAGERNGSWNIYKTAIAREDEESFSIATILTEESILETDDETFQPMVSPDGKKLAYLKNRIETMVLELAVD